MTSMAALAFAAVVFVGTHLLLSHPLRAPLVARLGERGFQSAYSLIAVATFAAMVWTYGRVPGQAPLWSLGGPAVAVLSLVMWVAAILLAGSFVGNPALPGMKATGAPPRGVFAITRHPMMWSFAIWAIVHGLVLATPRALLLDGTILVLALGGSALQDRKKAALAGSGWHEWKARTGFWPFARGVAWPGTLALAGGTILFLLATWLHPVDVGPWAFLR